MVEISKILQIMLVCNRCEKYNKQNYVNCVTGYRIPFINPCLHAELIVDAAYDLSHQKLCWE